MSWLRGWEGFPGSRHQAFIPGGLLKAVSAVSTQRTGRENSAEGTEASEYQETILSGVPGAWRVPGA